MSQNGKGSKPRPLSVDKETFNNNWDNIFNPDLHCSYSGLPSVSAYEQAANELLNISQQNGLYE
jgi:hypothetical protein